MPWHKLAHIILFASLISSLWRPVINCASPLTPSTSHSLLHSFKATTRYMYLFVWPTRSLFVQTLFAADTEQVLISIPNQTFILETFNKIHSPSLTFVHTSLINMIVCSFSIRGISEKKNWNTNVCEIRVKVLFYGSNRFLYNTFMSTYFNSIKIGRLLWLYKLTIHYLF